MCGRAFVVTATTAATTTTTTTTTNTGCSDIATILKITYGT